MTASAITATNIRSGETVKVPAPGRIVSVTYDHATNWTCNLRDAKWERRTVTGIVMAHGSEWDVLDRRGHQPSMTVLTLTGETKHILFSRIVKATATRSVPATAREVLASIYKWEAKEGPKWDARIRELEKQRDAARAAAGADDVKKALATATGAMTEGAFQESVRARLSARIPSFGADGWTVSLWGHRLSVRREVDIQKYYRGPLAYLEYDNTMSLVPDAESTAEGQAVIRRHRRELPLRAKLEESLSLGDKDWLVYEARYELADLDGLLLTEELAEEVVRKSLKAGSRA